MRLFMVDRDGVLVVNRSDNIKTPNEIELIPGAAEAVARLNRAGFVVVVCTNQPEVARGVMTMEQLDHVHDALKTMLSRSGATIDLILCCTSEKKCPYRKPAAGMLVEAMRRYGASPATTPFVGDQLDDLKAAFHAHCRRLLVMTGLGRKALERLPQYLQPVAIHDDLFAAAEAELARRP